jgi:hypothetical protein
MLQCYVDLIQDADLLLAQQLQRIHVENPTAIEKPIANSENGSSNEEAHMQFADAAASLDIDHEATEENEEITQKTIDLDPTGHAFITGDLPQKYRLLKEKYSTICPDFIFSL